MEFLKISIKLLYSIAHLLALLDLHPEFRAHPDEENQLMEKYGFGVEEAINDARRALLA